MRHKANMRTILTLAGSKCIHSLHHHIGLQLRQSYLSMSVHSQQSVERRVNRFVNTYFLATGRVPERLVVERALSAMEQIIYADFRRATLEPVASVAYTRNYPAGRKSRVPPKSELK